MTKTSELNLLDPLLDAYGRNNTIVLNLLGLLRPEELDVRAMDGSFTVAAHFAHIHAVRLFWLEQTAPGFARGIARLTHGEGEAVVPDHDPVRITERLNASAKAVVEAVQDRVESGLPLSGPHARYDHPTLLLQHLLWHEGYHVGQLKLALKAAGRVLTDEQEEGAIWSVWRTES